MRPIALLVLLVAAATLARSGTVDAEPRRPRSEPIDSTLARAERLFEIGRFDRAAAGLAAIHSSDPRVARMRGRLALLANRNQEAERWLRRALPRSGAVANGGPAADSTTLALLAESHYRRDRFARAAQIHRELGHEAMAKKLESLAGQKPYRLARGGDSTAVSFVVTDPLPVIEARVNDGPTVLLLLDTGASELILDSEFAERMGIPNFGEDTGTVAGDPRDPIGHGRIDSLAIGDFVCGPLPIRLLETGRLAALAGGRIIHGILGSVPLYHFVATIDYAGERLVLRRRGRAATAWLAEQARDPATTVVPFWMSGDHFIVAHGMVNRSGPHLLLVDTGLAGSGFTGPASIMTEARVRLFKGAARPGAGAGGPTRHVPLAVERLMLGEVARENVPGVFGVFPESLEHAHGFRIAGLVSHQFFRSHAVSFDFEGMRMLLRER